MVDIFIASAMMFIFIMSIIILNIETEKRRLYRLLTLTKHSTIITKSDPRSSYNEQFININLPEHDMDIYIKMDRNTKVEMVVLINKMEQNKTLKELLAILEKQ